MNEPLTRATLAVPAPPARASALRTAALRKRYKSRTVVQDVSLEVTSGEVVGLLGPERRRQDHLLLHDRRPGRRPTRGRIHLDEPRAHAAADPPPRAPRHLLPAAGELGVPQAHGGGERAGGARAAGRCAADEIETRLDELLERPEHRPPAQARRRCRCRAASGGALEIARALGTRPAFILLDEPFAGVDPIAVLDIQRIIRFLKERGIGVLITDHNVRETLGICDRAYIINEGAVLASGQPGGDRLQ